METLQIILQLLSVVVIPVIMFFYKKIEKIEILFNELLTIVGELQTKSDINDEELTKNWLQFYKNEIIRFNERIKMKPEHIPTPEHYKSVFDNFDRYKELGGNGYIDTIMENIRHLHHIHYGFEYKNKK